MNWEHVSVKLSSEMFQLSRSYEGQVHDYVVLIILQSQSTTSTSTIFEVTPLQGKLDAHITHVCAQQPSSHYGDVIMGMIASQITSLTIVYSTVYPVTGEFPAQMASNA